jgi:enediyne biosynthesis protein E4
VGDPGKSPGRERELRALGPPGVPMTAVLLKRAAAAVLGLGAVLALSCHRSAAPTAKEDEPAPPTPTPGLPWFEDLTGAAGIAFRHFDSSTPMDYVLERMGSGLGWIDYDNDGWPDLFCVQGGPLRPAKAEGPLPTCKLYRNNGDGTFRDVTVAVGLDRPCFGMGCAVGDYDNDGFDDLVVTYWGGILLYHNEPDGRGGRRFVDVTAKAGLQNPHWGTSCGWGDVDGDGLLDLYVCNYVEIDLDHYLPCEDPRTKARTHCPPTVFPHVTHRLFRNRGDGTFVDISKESGIAAVPPAPGLGVVLADLDGDGRIDIYAANDQKPAYLFHNQGSSRFVEKALLAGCALGPSARMMAGMGVQAGDIDGTGLPSLLVTDFYRLGSDLFRNRGGLTFQDWSNGSGVGPASRHRLGFGTVLCDVDLDGRLDVVTANGHVYRNAEELFGEAFLEEAQLFLGDGAGRFRDVSTQAGAYFRRRLLGRGLAWADYDNDGRPDLAFSHNGGPVVLLRNATATSNNWLRLELVGDGKKSNRNAIGARVEISHGGAKQTHFVNGGGSYLSASDRRLLIGLGPAEEAERVVVVWPSGRRQEFPSLRARSSWRLYEGKEAPVPITPAGSR